MFAGIYHDRRVLVTGHTGFKGSWLSQWLLRLGAKVSGASLYVPSQPSHFELLELGRRLSSHTIDVREVDAMQKVLERERPEVVFHLAAQPIVRAAYDNPKLTFDTNVGGVVNVLEAVRRVDFVKAVVVITSDKCYENVEWEFGYRESDRLGGKDPYSASKACAEIVFSAYQRSYFSRPGSPALAAGRAGNVIGGGDWAADRIVPDCIRAWAEGRRPLIRSPRATRPWQHVLEPLGGYLWLAARLLEEAPLLRGEAFNFGPAAHVSASVEELLREMAGTWPGAGWDVDPAAAQAKAEASLLKLNCDKALARLSWQAVLTFEETAAMTAGWYHDFHGGHRSAAACTDAQIEQYEQLAKQRGRIWAAS